MLLASTRKSAHGKDQFGRMVKDTFNAIINELKFLKEEGILIKTYEGVKRVYSVVPLVSGDNVGINLLYV